MALARFFHVDFAVKKFPRKSEYINFEFHFKILIFFRWKKIGKKFDASTFVRNKFVLKHFYQTN